MSAFNGPFSRREFLGGVGAGALGVSALAATLGHPSLIRAIGANLESVTNSPQSVAPLTPAGPVLTIAAERDTDLFLADFTFYGFTVDKTSKPPALVATTAAAANKWIGVTVKLPPQAIAEGSYPTPPAAGENTLPFDPTPVLSQLSGPTLLAFTFLTGDTIPLPTMTVADLQEWSGWDVFVPQTAITGTGLTSPVEPLAFQTQIECPIDLLLAPVVQGTTKRSLGHITTQFENRTEPLTSSQQVTECWTTNLVNTETIIDLNGVQHYAVTPSVAAVWSNDYFDKTPDSLTGENYIAYYEYVNIQ